MATGPIAPNGGEEGPATRSHGKSETDGSRQIGPYKLLHRIGEGGMGEVWVAEQREPVKRQVAVKLIKAGMDSKSVLARFEVERQALALMDHPNIARILDGGITDTGSPYFVMELVKGVPITEFCDARKLSPRQRLELFIPVCQAIQHAHQKGIIHRDIKPSNVMISLYDDKPAPKVIDFGVAKATGQALTEHTLNTGFSVVGTPQYMSPEQATFNQLDIDTRSDIYSLGVLLYELLAGSTPFERAELQKAGYLEVLRVIREEEPPRPSTKLSTSKGLPSISATRSTEPKRLTGLLRNELDWIVMKSLEKDRARRYETANAFAADIGRYLMGEAVQAHPPSQAYRLRKFLRKNRASVVAASLIFVALLAGMVGTGLGLREAIRQRVIAEGKQKEAERERKKAAESALIAIEQQKKAEKAENEALDAYRASTDDAIEQLLAEKETLGEKEKEYLQKTRERWMQFAAREGGDEQSLAIRAEGQYRVGMIWQRLDRNQEAQDELQKSVASYIQLVQAYPQSQAHQLALARAHGKLGLVQTIFGKSQEAEQQCQAAIDLLTKLCKTDPLNIAYSSSLADVYRSHAFAIWELGKTDQALKSSQKAIDLYQAILDRVPENIEYRGDLAASICDNGVFLHRRRKYDEATRELSKAIGIFRGLLDQSPNDAKNIGRLAHTQGELGNLLTNVSKYDEALVNVQGAFESQRKLVTQFPNVPRYRCSMAMDLSNHARILGLIGRVDEALSEVNQAIDIQLALVREYPKDVDYALQLQPMHNNLSDILRKSTNHEQVIANYRSAIRNLQVTIGKPASNTEQNDIVIRLRIDLTALLRRLGRIEDLKAEVRVAIDHFAELRSQFPGEARYSAGLAIECTDYGSLLCESGNPKGSLEWFERSLRTLEGLTSLPPGRSKNSPLASSYAGRASALYALQDFQNSLLDWNRALELAEESRRAPIRLGRAMSQLRVDSISEAIDEAVELAKIRNWRAGDWYNLACIYSVASAKVTDQKDTYSHRAIELLKLAAKAGFKDAEHLANDVDFAPLREQEDFRQILASLREAPSRSGNDSELPNEGAKPEK